MLLKALEVFKRHHLLDVWEEGKIRLSTAWNDEIEEATSSSILALFLLTPEALESDYIRTIELPYLRERWRQEKKPVFPVVCEPCRWKEQRETSSSARETQCCGGCLPVQTRDTANPGPWSCPPVCRMSCSSATNGSDRRGPN